MKRELRFSLGPLLIVILCVVASWETLGLRTLIDESFLLAWAKAKSSMIGAGDFYGFHGLLPTDQWGPLTPFSIQLSAWTSFGASWIWRLHDLLLKIIAAILIFYVVKRLSGIFWLGLAAAAAAAFLLPPPYLGARAVLLATVFGAASIYFYLKSFDQENRSLPNIVISMILLCFTLAAELSAWMMAPVYALIELLFWKKQKGNSTMAIVMPLIPIVICAAGLAATGFHQTWAKWRFVKHLREHSKFASALRGQLKKYDQVVVTDVPENIAASPLFQTNGAVLFNPKSGTVASNRISGGRLKDALRAGTSVIQAYRWDGKRNILSPMYTPYGTSTKPFEFSSEQLKMTMLRLDAQSTGPVMRCAADWLNPMTTDFIWIDAKIDGNSAVTSSVHLAWTTALLQQYDLHFRDEALPAIVGDGQFHRYFFPVRSTNWYASGQPQTLTFGFPVGSKVELKAMGTMGKEDRIPKFDLLEPAPKAAITAPCFGFPSSPNLGTFVTPPGTGNLKASIGTPKEAVGVTVEISLPGKDFENENGTKLSGVTYKTVPIESKEPTIQVPIDDLPETGIYALRAIAIDKKHNFMGNFSDTIYVFVERPNRGGWRTE